VPDEDDPALVPGDAVSTVRDRAHGHLELGTGPPAAPVLARRTGSARTIPAATAIRHRAHP
jgi:hypothetical protein